MDVSNLRRQGSPPCSTLHTVPDSECHGGMMYTPPRMPVCTTYTDGPPPSYTPLLLPTPPSFPFTSPASRLLPPMGRCSPLFPRLPLPCVCLLFYVVPRMYTLLCMGPVLLSARILPFGSASVGGCPPFLVWRCTVVACLYIGFLMSLAPSVTM